MHSMKVRPEGRRRGRLSIVVIGYNEGTNLSQCFASIRSMRRVAGLDTEVIYVDGGSDDDSVSVAQDAGVPLVLGGEKRRRAAENRNLGMQAASGEYVQFLDGDMTLDPEWCVAAHAFMTKSPGVAAVCGNLHEVRENVFYRAMELDWGVREGAIRHCGGAALWRKEILEKLGGFPEDVRYGEEPYLCWRVRNELHLVIYQLNRPMVTHDLGHTSFGDYWRRCVRTGRAYAEIADHFARTKDPLWLHEALMNVFWAAALVIAIALPCFFRSWWAAATWVLIACLVLRKMWQALRQGMPARTSLVYAVHTYLSKIPLATGEVLWALHRIRTCLISRFKKNTESPDA
jgi:glycosyltransferase involved in cell wall biosynthesis